MKKLKRTVAIAAAAGTLFGSAFGLAACGQNNQPKVENPNETFQAQIADLQNKLDKYEAALEKLESSNNKDAEKAEKLQKEIDRLTVQYSLANTFTSRYNEVNTHLTSAIQTQMVIMFGIFPTQNKAKHSFTKQEIFNF